jgi:hypothetical protein
VLVAKILEACFSFTDARNCIVPDSLSQTQKSSTPDHSIAALPFKKGIAAQPAHR